jgi:hypothetical protein
MEQSSKQDDCHSARQEICHVLWNPKFHCRFHKSSPLMPVLSQLNPVYNLTSFFFLFRIYFNVSSNPRPDHSRCHLFLGFPTKICIAFLTSPMSATCLPLYTSFNISGNIWRTVLIMNLLLYISLTLPVISSLLDPKFLLSTAFNLCYPLRVRNQVPLSYRTTDKIIDLYISLWPILMALSH